jgi:hypothetical protein
MVAVTDMSATSRIAGSLDRETRWSETPNWMVRFPNKQQQLLVTDASKKHWRMDPLMINQRAVKGEQGRGARLWQMERQKPTWRKVQRRWQLSKIGF